MFVKNCVLFSENMVCPWLQSQKGTTAKYHQWPSFQNTMKWLSKMELSEDKRSKLPFEERSLFAGQF